MVQGVQEEKHISLPWLHLSGENRVELTGPSLADHTTLDAVGAFRERIAFNMRYFLPRYRAAEVLGKLLEQTGANITEAGGERA